MAPREPFDLGRGEPVLLLHGFGGSPFELRPVGEALAAGGFRAVAPVLPGHEDGPEGMLRGDADRWLAGAATALERSRARRVVGFSMGGCLALRLAATWRELEAIALLAPALSFHGASRLYVELFRLPLAGRLAPTLPKGDPDVRDPVMRLASPGMRRVPAACARELRRTSRAARAALPLVKAPAIVLWGALDAVVPRSAAELAASAIGSGPAPLHVFGRSAHQLALDHEREAVAACVLRFFQEGR